MRTSHLIVPALWAVLLLGAGAQNAWATARADALEMEDKDRATLSKETMKQKRMGNGRTDGLHMPNSQQGCGNVDIGNADGDKKGSGRVAERNRTVIVTGNVYNTAQCR